MLKDCRKVVDKQLAEELERRRVDKKAQKVAKQAAEKERKALEAAQIKAIQAADQLAKKAWKAQAWQEAAEGKLERRLLRKNKLQKPERNCARAKGKGRAVWRAVAVARKKEMTMMGP